MPKPVLNVLAPERPLPGMRIGSVISYARALERSCRGVRRAIGIREVDVRHRLPVTRGYLRLSSVPFLATQRLSVFPGLLWPLSDGLPRPPDGTSRMSHSWFRNDSRKNGLGECPPVAAKCRLRKEKCKWRAGARNLRAKGDP